MTYIPEFNNEDDDANLVENKARIKPDYSILSTDTLPTLTTDDAGRIAEYTDTGDRFRWAGDVWVRTHIAGNVIISDGDSSITVDAEIVNDIDNPIPVIQPSNQQLQLDQTHQRLDTIVEQLKIMNLHLSLITNHELTINDTE